MPCLSTASYKTVSVYYYVTQDSFDLYVLQLLNYKKNFVEQMMRGDITQRASKNIDGGIYTELMTIASSNEARKFSATRHEENRCVVRSVGTKPIYCLNPSP